MSEDADTSDCDCCTGAASMVKAVLIPSCADSTNCDGWSIDNKLDVSSMGVRGQEKEDLLS